jgi:hypothetical protein
MTDINQLMRHPLDGLQTENTAASAGAAVTLIDVLPYLGRALGLQGLACLAACSRQLSQTCIYIAEIDAGFLLLDALPAVQTGDDLAAAAAAAAAAEEAAAYSPMYLADDNKRLLPVIWLLYVARSVSCGPLTATDVLQRLLHLPPRASTACAEAACSRHAHSLCSAAGSSPQHGARSGGVGAGPTTAGHHF